MEEYIQSNDYNQVKEEKDATIQEYQEEVEITIANDSSDTESKAFNVRKL